MAMTSRPLETLVAAFAILASTSTLASDLPTISCRLNDKIIVNTVLIDGQS